MKSQTSLYCLSKTCLKQYNLEWLKINLLANKVSANKRELKVKSKGNKMECFI